MSGVRYYQTIDMEEAVRSMAQRNREVLVLMDYKSVKPIRMRTKAKLADLDIDWVMAWKPGADEAVERWRKRGGILQYRSTPTRNLPYCPPADSILFVECPMQWARFEHTCRSARQEVVVYRPPTWSLHERTIDHLYPSRETYATIDAYLDALEHTPQTHPLLDVVGYKRAVAFTAAELGALTGWDERYVRYVLRPYKFQVQRWHPYRLRMKPEDPDLVWAWEVLRSQPQIAPRVHAIRYNMVRPRLAGFQSMLKLLVKQKYVGVEDCVYVADAERHRKDVDALDAVNNMRRGRWFKLREFVDSLDEYPV